MLNSQFKNKITILLPTTSFNQKEANKCSHLELSQCPTYRTERKMDWDKQRAVSTMVVERNFNFINGADYFVIFQG